MPAIEKTQTQDEIDAGNAVGLKATASLLDKIKSGDVVNSLEAPPTEEETSQEEETTEEGQEQEEGEQGQEETEDNAEDSEEDIEGEEEMIPRSKVQDRIDRIKSENKALKAQIESQEINRRTQEEKAVDDETKQLRGMSEKELETLKDQIDDAKFDARTAKDTAKLAQLKALERKVDETIRTAPQRFVNAQINAYNKKADELAASGKIKNMDAAAPKIIEEAKKIYARYPKLAHEVDGQAIALELAAERYIELSRYTLTKGSVNNLKSQVNKLKAKTSLETKQSKSTGDSQVLETLRKNASGGTTKDKVSLVRNDPRFMVDAMIPAEYK